MLILRAEGAPPAPRLPGPGSLAQGWRGPAASRSSSEVPVRQPDPPLIYCVLALFAAIKLSSNSNVFMFSHIYRMKVNIFIILPSPPHGSSPALNMWVRLKGKSYKEKFDFTPPRPPPSKGRSHLPVIASLCLPTVSV